MKASSACCRQAVSRELAIDLRYRSYSAASSRLDPALTPTFHRLNSRTVVITIFALFLNLMTITHAEDASRGEKLYRSRCVVCHGYDATGSLSLRKQMDAEGERLNLIGPHSLKRTTLEFVEITEKGSQRMPGYQGKLSSSEIRDIDAYLRAVSSGTPEQPETDGAKLFRSKCSSCHGEGGRGHLLMSKVLKAPPAALDLLDTGTLTRTDGVLVSVIENGEHRMPGYKKQLSRSEIKALISFLRSLAKGQ